MRPPVFLALAVLSAAAIARAGSSIYALRPDDPQAAYVGSDALPAKGDGVADDTAALQAAIDHVQESTRRGVVFIPEGRYRLTHELRVWSGIRLVGWGAHRPVFCLGPNTPGFQEGPDHYLVHFVSDRPTRPGQPVRDANPGTFYSALTNIDLEIADGNPAAVGVRSHFAQHCFIAHVDFRLGSARAGIEEVGNEAEDLSFEGGEFGITTHKPSPSWPFLLIDSRFSGQRRAAIETEEGGMTLIRDRFEHTPTVVLVRPDRAEELWMEDCVFREITGPAIVCGEDRNARTQLNLRNVACHDVPVLAHLHDTARTFSAPAADYRVATFVHGLQYADVDALPAVGTTCELEPGVSAPAVPSDIAPLPPMTEWANLRSLGAKGDGVADDTEALRAAIARRRVIYLPSGRYRVTDTETLRPDTVLIGFNPITTQILLPDFTPAFQGVNGPTGRPAAPSVPAAFRAWMITPPFPGKGPPKPMLEAPMGGTNIVAGIGLDCGGVNNRAVALKWMAGAKSLVNDVRFLGGHGTYGPDGQWLAIYNDTRTGDADPQRRWDSQCWSLWVTNGGGGVFKDIWTPDSFAAAGVFVSETATRGRIYALSSEHHVRNEVKLRGVSHWRIDALQTEEERGESPHALPLEIQDCSDIGVANFFIYRVDIPVAAPSGIRVTRSTQLEFDGLHVYSPGKLSFDNTLVDVTRGVEIRSREIARLQVGAEAKPRTTMRAPPDLVDGPLRKVAGGFENIEGLISAPNGDVLFVDQAVSRIHRFSAVDGLTLESDAVPQPVALAIDKSGDVVVVSRHGNVYSLPPRGGEAGIRVVEPASAGSAPGATAWLPLNRWRDGHDWLAANTRHEPGEYASSDGTIAIPAPASYSGLMRPGGLRGAGTIDLARAYALGPARPGQAFYVSDEFGQTTWRFDVASDGTLGNPERFAEEGEAGTAVDAAGNVYVCAGNVFVYDRAGRLLGTIEVPERPSALAFGGADRRTLYVAARTSLYAIHWRNHGR
ncbi:MAG TPA: glycosyl hydrolase family 28-related protein [Candidatus Didemnitutus sp.]|jgi:sugar lactone lactonase YvrE